MTVIKRTIAKTYYPNISNIDAQEIITRLGIKDRDVYYIDGDEFGCLVVLHEFDKDSCLVDHLRQPPYVLFQQKYQEFNQARTVVMTPPRAIISCQRKRRAFLIKRKLKIKNLKRRLKVLTSSK